MERVGADWRRSKSSGPCETVRGGAGGRSRVGLCPSSLDHGPAPPCLPGQWPALSFGVCAARAGAREAGAGAGAGAGAMSGFRLHPDSCRATECGGGSGKKTHSDLWVSNTCGDRGAEWLPPRHSVIEGQGWHRATVERVRRQQSRQVFFLNLISNLIFSLIFCFPISFNFLEKNSDRPADSSGYGHTIGRKGNQWWVGGRGAVGE